MSVLERIAAAVPGLRLVRDYQRDWLRPDALAALTVWALLVPQALAYAKVAGLDPVVGLYAALGGILGYLLFGTVREMSVGPEGTIALLAATVVAPMAAGDPGRYAVLAATLALVTGTLLVMGGVARLGFVARFLSRPLLVGYVAGSAIIMIIGQLDSLLGVELGPTDGAIDELFATIGQLPETDPATLTIGLLVMGVALAVRAIDRRLPAYLIAIAVAIVASVVLDLQTRGVEVVGTITPGLPAIGLPTWQLRDFTGLVVPALAVAFLIFADSGITGQVLGKRGNYPVDGDAEFIGLGAANIGAGLTSGFPVNGSQSRSFTAADVGARTGGWALGALVLVVLTLIALTPLFAPLPDAALAAIIIIVALGLIDVPELRELLRLDQSEFGLAALAAFSVIVVGMVSGVVLVVMLSLFMVARRAAVPRTTTLVRAKGSGHFVGADTDEDGTAAEELIVYRFDAPLFFANAGILASDIRSLVAAADTKPRGVVLDAETIYEIDSTATEALRDLVTDLHDQDIAFALARVKSPVRTYLERAGLVEIIGPQNFYHRVDDAVRALNAR